MPFKSKHGDQASQFVLTVIPAQAGIQGVEPAFMQEGSDDLSVFGPSLGSDAHLLYIFILSGGAGCGAMSVCFENSPIMPIKSVESD